MKRLLFLLIAALFFFVSKSRAQLSVGYHQSSFVSLIAVGYETGDRFSPEIRIGTNVYLNDPVIEVVGRYDFIQKEKYDFYAGLGGLFLSDYGGIVAPVGFVFYPFEERKFGFHLEAAPMVGEDVILRGSWGIIYKFGN